MNQASIKCAYARWWLGDLPPLSGPLRFLFYGGLFALCFFHWKSPLQALELYERTDPTLFRSFGLFQLLGIPHLPAEWVRGTVWITTIAWITSAIGLFTRTSMILTALGALFLHGLFWGSNAFNHSWCLPVYTLVLLAFARTSDQWSLDRLLPKWVRQIDRKPFTSVSILDTGFARKAVLVVAVGFYFAAGMSKLLESGFIWFDGLSLQYHLIDKEAAPWMASRLWLCQLTSILTVVLEIGSLAALFSRRALAVWILGILTFHFGIWITVGPWYWANMFCLILVVDWGRLWQRLRALRPSVKVAPPVERPVPAFTSAGLAGATTMFPVLLIVAVAQIEWWPLTNVPMFSAYCGADYHMGVHEDEFKDEGYAQQLARDCLDHGSSVHIKKTLAYRTSLVLAADYPRRLRHNLGERPLGVPTYSQWAKTVVQPAIIADLAAKPDGRIAHDKEAPDTPLNRLLEELLPVIKREVQGWRAFDRAEFVYKTAKGNVVVASVPLRSVPSIAAESP